MKARRTSYEIYWEILVFCRQPHSFTSIINRCDLNSKIGQQHLEFLTTKGYLKLEHNDDKKLYVTTESAQEYLTLFTQLYRTLFENSPGFKL
jgi:predicted transcriptional regulator